MSIAYDVVTQSGVSKVTSMSVLRDLEADDLEGAFTIHVTHGHLIRSLIHVLRDILAYGILELTPTKMRLLRLDKTERVIVAIDIDTSRFFQYLFVSRRGVIRIGISFAVLWQCIKVIGKQDSFIMSKNDGDDFVILDFGNAARQQYALQGVCDQILEVPVYRSKQPNVYITVKELTKAMSYLRTERGRAHIKGYRDRIVVEALGGKKVQRMGVSFDDVWKRVGLTPSSLHTMMRENSSLKCSLHLNDAGTGIAELEITENYAKYGSGAVPTVDLVQSHLVLKSLSKVYTIAPNSSVLATVEAGVPIRIVIPIGDYGHLTLYLLSAAWGGGTAIADDTPPAITAPILEEEAVTAEATPATEEEAVRPKPSRSRRTSSRRKAAVVEPAEQDGPTAGDAVIEIEEAPAPAPAPRSSRRRAAAAAASQ